MNLFINRGRSYLILAAGGKLHLVENLQIYM